MTAMPMRAPHAVPYSQFAYEAFALGSSTRLYDPLSARTLPEALAETTSRWAWDRGDRLGIREVGEGKDRLHVYAVRKKSAGTKVWRDFIPSTEHERWLEHVCTVDLNVIAGIAHGLVGTEVELHNRRQWQRPTGARKD